ncbi:hypothetical protein O7626_09740 [Micromonospora sp. WMMD1102]|uniref:hypothetical protein n=1 Tax=Micromonospora sp. WMMD1102 TaxID=3016105 RepID=UPI002414E9AC|nr:hypothetical protein [Micromonospora sp. WMMD1102]MDG4786204.1 hypothetical protein [Micromonospora sp. WMMD1102]
MAPSVRLSTAAATPPRVGPRSALLLLAQLRRSHDHLSPRHRPALATYGPAAAAMAVALFGTEVLGELDQEMAAEAYVEHRAVDTGPTGAPGAGYGHAGHGDPGSGADGGASGGGGCGGGCGGGGGS